MTLPPQSSTARDATVDRLRELTERLSGCLVEAQDIRARFIKARDGNVWPDFRSAPLPLPDHDSRVN